MSRHDSSVPSFFMSFIAKGCWILSKTFSTSFEMTVLFLFLIVFMCYITFTDLHILDHPCILEMQPKWLWCMIFLMGCWILFATILLRIFVSISSRELAYSFLFCLVLYQGDEIALLVLKCSYDFFSFNILWQITLIDVPNLVTLTFLGKICILI
jgi:hypothetical protein